MKNIENLILEYKNIFENYLDSQLNLLPKCELSDTIIYSLKNGGKRLRPVLMLITANLLGVELDRVLPFAYSLEIIHSSSLVHDDLPAIDNDDFRRGRLSCHKKFGEAEGVLCGDAMLNYAYESALANCKDLKDIKCLYALSFLTGINGMLGGQYLDVTCEKRKISSNEILYIIQKNKTGALIKESVRIGALLAGATTQELQILTNYAENIGLAFQIKDDILSEIGDSKKMGKPVGNDRERRKATYVTIYGLERAQEMLDDVINEAMASIRAFGDNSEFLLNLALYIKNRER